MNDIRTLQRTRAAHLLLGEAKKELEAVARPPTASDLLASLTPKELEAYSPARAISALLTQGRGANSLELEVSAELAKTFGTRTQNSILLPLPLVMERDVAVAASGGAFLVGTEIGPAFNALRNRMFTAKFGAVLYNFAGYVSFPVVTVGATAYWLTDEATAITPAAETIGFLALTPKTVGIYTKISRQLLAQAPVADTVVRRELTIGLAAALDAAVVNGAGNVEPLGILNCGSVNAISGASLEWGDLLDAIVAAGDAGAGGFALAADAYKIAASREVVADSGVMCLRDAMIDGRQTVITSGIPDGTILTGPWDQCAVALWGALELMSDPYSDFKSGAIGMRGMLTADAGVARPELFSAITSVS